MEIDRETVVQIAISGSAVVLFVVVAVYVSGVYGTNGNLTSEGGIFLVGAIAAFVVFVTLAGLWLSRQDF